MRVGGEGEVEGREPYSHIACRGGWINLIACYKVSGYYWKRFFCETKFVIKRILQHGKMVVLKTDL